MNTCFTLSKVLIIIKLIVKSVFELFSRISSVSEDDEEVTCQVKREYVALNAFKDLYKHSPVVQMAFEFGNSIIPLSAVGMILNYSGNHLLHYISTVFHKKVFYPSTRVVSVTLCANGDIITTTVRT